MNPSLLFYISRTDAEAFVNRFGNALQNPNSSPLVFHIWGVGGVGKTNLTEKLKEWYIYKADFAEVSFDYTKSTEEKRIQVMDKLYKALPEIPFLKKSFDDMMRKDAFKELYQTFLDTVIKLETEPVEGKKEVDKEQSELVKEGLNLAVKNLFKLSPIALPDTLTEKGAEITGDFLADKKNQFSQFLQKHKATKQRRDLQDLILDPVTKLTEAFVKSLKARKRPVVLVFDTYEKAPVDIDTWLWQDLIANTDIANTDLKACPVRIVIAGRNSILKNEQWRKLQQNRNLIYECQLNRFDEEQTEQYLRNIGINDTEQISKIFNITKGLPYYLNWIREKQARGVPLDFSQGNKEIINLLLQGLNNTQKRVLKLASCCRWFNEGVIENLINQQEGLDFNTAVDDKPNYFEWLKQRDFVELSHWLYYLDDVARDVFHESFWREERQQFEQIHQQLATYFKTLADREVSADSSPLEKYNNPAWRKHIAEYLYHTLYEGIQEGTQESQIQFSSYLFESLYFNQNEIIQDTLNAIATETNLLDEEYKLIPYIIKKFLIDLLPAIFLAQFILVDYPIDYKNLAERGLSKTVVDQTITTCFRYLKFLTGLSKFAALLYRSRRCSENERLKYLNEAKLQAEQILSDHDLEFNSTLYAEKLAYGFYIFEQYEQAVQSYDRAIEFKLDYHEAWYNRGVVLGNLGRWKEAVQSYDKAFEIKPDFHEVWYNRGNALGKLERWKEAVKSYDRAIEFKPDDHEAWYNRGNALGELERLEEALQSYDRAIEIKPDLHQAWYNRGVVLGNLGRWKEEIQSYDRAISIKPNFHGAWKNRGINLGNLGRWEEEIQSYDKAIEIKPNDHEAWYNRGNALGKLERLEEALQSYDRAIEIKPNFSEAWSNRGNALGNLGRWEEALQSYDKAIGIKHDDHETWNNRGLALTYLERYSDALKSYQQSIKIQPEYSNVYYSLACCYALQENIDLALSNLQKAINFDKKYREMAKTDKDFNKIRSDGQFQELVD